MVRIVAVSGSLRDESYTRRGLAHALRTTERAGGDVELIDLRTVDLPLFDPDDREVGDAAVLKEAVRAADGVLLGSPVYHGSYSAAFRNFHDYCGFDEYEDTVVGLLAVAGGGSYGSTLDHMRVTVRGVHGWVLPHQVGIRNASEKFNGDDIVAPGIRERVEKLGQLIAEHARGPSPVRAGGACADD